jgi:hypothetical protein
MSKQPPIWRRKYIINLEFQGAFIQKALFIAFAINVIFYFALEFIFIKFNIYGESLQHEARVKFYSFLKDQKQILNQTFIYVGSVSALFIVIWGIFQSHRIAGPLFNLKLQFKKMKGMKSIEEIGELNKTKFRANDYFHDLAEDYNHFVDHLTNLANAKEKTTGIQVDNVADFQTEKAKKAESKQSKKAS